MTDSERDEVRERACVIWESEGCPVGEDALIWATAAAMVEKRRRDKRWVRFFNARRA